MILEEGKEEMPLPDIWISAKENFGSDFDLENISCYGAYVLDQKNKKIKETQQIFSYCSYCSQ